MIRTNRPSTHRVLLLHGGWEGHQPNLFADFAEQTLLTGCEVVRAQDPSVLTPETLAQFDLILPVWTYGALSAAQESCLLDAVAGGMGYVGWHGNASSFLESRRHKLLLGGQFVAHPGGDEVTYPVRFHRDDPLVSDLRDTSITSEQYYLLVDPAVKVLASTVIDGADHPWLAGTRMPIAWKRRWGAGRVFYCSLGHTVDTLKTPPVFELLTRAIRWAMRGSPERYE